MSRFTVKDLPMIGRAFKGKWNMPDAVREDCKKVIKEGLQSEDPKIAQQAVTLVMRADMIDLKHHQVMVPRMDVDLTSLTDQQIDDLLKELESGQSTGRSPLEFVAGEATPSSIVDQHVSAGQSAGSEPARLPQEPSKD